jgi:hypothetical protein
MLYGERISHKMVLIIKITSTIILKSKEKRDNFNKMKKSYHKEHNNNKSIESNKSK